MDLFKSRIGEGALKALQPINLFFKRPPQSPERFQFHIHVAAVYDFRRVATVRQADPMMEEEKKSASLRKLPPHGDLSETMIYKKGESSGNAKNVIFLFGFQLLLFLEKVSKLPFVPLWGYLSGHLHRRGTVRAEVPISCILSLTIRVLNEKVNSELSAASFIWNLGSRPTLRTMVSSCLFFSQWKLWNWMWGSTYIKVRGEKDTVKSATGSIPWLILISIPSVPLPRHLWAPQCVRSDWEGSSIPWNQAFWWRRTSRCGSSVHTHPRNWLHHKGSGKQPGLGERKREKMRERREREYFIWCLWEYSLLCPVLSFPILSSSIPTECMGVKMNTSSWKRGNKAWIIGKESELNFWYICGKVWWGHL